MEKSSFLEVLKNQGALAHLNQSDLDASLKEFPYFNNLHVLAAKKAKMENVENQAEYLFNAALQTSSRTRLYHFMEAEIPAVEVPVKKAATEKTFSSNLIESLKSIKQHSSDSYSPKTKDDKKAAADTKKTPKAKPHKKSKSPDSYSFTDWLIKVKNKKVAANTESIEPRENELEEVDELIKAHAYEAQLMKTAAQIKSISKVEDQEKLSKEQVKEINMDELAKKSSNYHESNITETLAGIFEKQNRYTKAIEAYEFLSLKYPEKSSFFASKIKNLKNKL